MKKIFILLFLVAPIMAGAQQKVKRGLEVGADNGTRIVVDSIIEVDGSTLIYYNGKPYSAVNVDSLPTWETDPDLIYMPIWDNGKFYRAPKSAINANVLSDIGKLNDSITELRTALDLLSLESEFDSIVVKADNTKVYGYLTTAIGQVRIVWDVSGVEDDVAPTFVSAEIGNVANDILVITMSEAILDSITESGGASGTITGATHAYNFDEIIGSLTDQVGSDDGTPTSVIQGDSPGVFTRAYYFDGDGYVQLATGVNYGTGNLAGSVWVKPFSLASDFRLYSGETNSFFIGYSAGNNGLWAGKVGVDVSTATTLDLTENAWNHVAWSYDQTANVVTFWIDGTSEQESYSSTFSGVSNYIGASATPASFLNGLMDEFVTWTGDTLWQERVDSLYNSGSGRRFNDFGAGLSENQDSIKNAFTVNIESSPVSVDSVIVLSEKVRLLLASSATWGDVVTVVYNKPVTYGLRDTADNYTVSWTAKPVTNNVDSATSFLYVKVFDYQSETLGTWTEGEAASYYGTVSDNNSHNNTDIVNWTINGTASKALRIKHRPITPDEFGSGGAECTVYLDTSMLESWMTYYVELGANFQSMNDGKLSGWNSLQGVSEPRDVWSDGFLARLQMKAAGYIDTYHYDDTHWDYTLPGDKGWVPWSYEQLCGCKTDYYFLTFGSPHKIDLHMVYNTYTNGVSNDDGIFEAALDDQIVYQETGISFHDIEADTNRIHAIGITNFWNQEVANTFYCYYDSIIVYVPLNDTEKGGLHTSMWDSPLAVPTDTLYYDEFVYTSGDTVTTPTWPTSDPSFTNRRYLIDAGVGNKVTWSWIGGNIDNGDYVVFYNGPLAGSTRLSQTEIDLNLTDNASVSSTGRFLYVYYCGDTGGGSKWRAKVTFTPQ